MSRGIENGSNFIRPYKEKIVPIGVDVPGVDFVGTRPSVPDEFTSTMKNVSPSLASLELRSRKMIFGNKPNSEESRKPGNQKKENPTAPIIIELGNTIRREVAARGLTGKEAEEEFYKLFNEATDPYKQENRQFFSGEGMENTQDFIDKYGPGLQGVLNWGNDPDA